MTSFSSAIQELIGNELGQLREAVLADEAAREWPVPGRASCATCGESLPLARGTECPLCGALCCPVCVTDHGTPKPCPKCLAETPEPEDLCPDCHGRGRVQVFDCDQETDTEQVLWAPCHCTREERP